MLAQSATAALYLHTRASREERLARHNNNNNTHHVKNRNPENIKVGHRYSAQPQKTNFKFTFSRNSEETVVTSRVSCSQQDSQPSSGQRVFQQLRSLVFGQSSRDQESCQSSNLQRPRLPQPADVQEPWQSSNTVPSQQQQPSRLHAPHQSSNFPKSRQPSCQYVYQPSCLRGSQQPCSLHVSQQPCNLHLSQESSISHVSQHPSGFHFSQLSCKIAAWSERSWKADDWKINYCKSLEWIKSGDWKPEWFKDRDLANLLKTSAAWGTEWLKSEWQKTKDSDMPIRPIGDWFGLKVNIQEGMEMKQPSYAQVQR